MISVVNGKKILDKLLNMLSKFQNLTLISNLTPVSSLERSIYYLSFLLSFFLAFSNHLQLLRMMTMNVWRSSNVEVFLLNEE